MEREKERGGVRRERDSERERERKRERGERGFGEPPLARGRAPAGAGSCT